MADEEINETGEDTGEDSPVITRLRQQAREGDAARKELESARRELAFAKAGIDTDSRLGKMLFQTYDGDLSDTEALKTEATELGLLKSETAPEATETATREDLGTNTRRTLADGAPADFGGSEDPRESSLREAQDAIKNGSRAEVAQGHFINQRAQAALGGDRRVILDPKGQNRLA